MFGNAHYWTPGETEVLIARWASNHPAEAIAADLGVTTAAVTMKANRMHLRRSLRWPPDREERLAMLWKEGWGGPQLSKEFGISRGAILGKLQRLGLLKRGFGKHRSRGNAGGDATALAVAVVRKRKPKPLPAFEPGQKPPGFVGIPFLNLEPWQCRYPYGEGSSMLFCGKRKMEESSYCPDCHSVCHGAVREKTGPFVLRYFAARAA
jgi:hypothetical protein